MSDVPRRGVGALGWSVRGAAIFAMAAAVGAAAYLVLGPPSPERVYAQDEIARFIPTWGHGVGQLLGEGVLLSLVAYIARKWLKVRL